MRGNRVRPPTFSDAAIQFCLSIKVLFTPPCDRLPGRSPAFCVRPGSTGPCRMPQKTLAVQILYRRADGLLNQLVVSTGIKFLGDGGWQARKHGVQGRRQWRKVHLAMDPATSDVRDVGKVPPIPVPIVQVPASIPERVERLA